MAKILKFTLFFALFFLSSANSNSLFVLDSKKLQDGVELRLSDDLSEKELKISELKEKDNYRKIIDFKASLDGGRKNYDFDDVKISIAQFNPQTTRIVLSSKDEVKSLLDLGVKQIIKFTY